MGYAKHFSSVTGHLSDRLKFSAGQIEILQDRKSVASFYHITIINWPECPSPLSPKANPTCLNVIKHVCYRN